MLWTAGHNSRKRALHTNQSSSSGSGSRKTDCRLLVDQSHYEASGEDRAHAPVPLGKIGRQIVVPRSWEIEDAPRRSIDRYEELVGAARRGVTS